MANLAIESNFFRVYSAAKFLEGLQQTQLSTNNLYVFIGKTTPWGSPDNAPQPNDTNASRDALFNTMLAVKRVAPSDVILVIPNHTWTSGTIYTQYSSNGAEVGGIYYDQFEPLLAIPPFYVITSDYNVYVCLGNNSGGTSSVMPTGTGTTPITLADGYSWKFMFQVSSENVTQFLSTGWIPIYTLTYNDGSLQWAIQSTAAANDPGTDFPGGLGSDPVYQLGAMWVMVDIDFNYDESGKISTSTEYRQFGLLLNPLAYGSSLPFEALVGTGTTNLTLSRVTGTYCNNDHVTGYISHATAYVVDYEGALPNVLRLIQVSGGPFIIGETLTDDTSSATSIVSAIANPDIQPNSGYILSCENLSTGSIITRGSTELETIKIVAPF